MVEGMTHILQVTSSVKGPSSRSTQLSEELVAGLLARDPGARVSRRDVAAQPVPIVDATTLRALSTPADQRSAEHAARVAELDALIAEIQSADVVVLGVPMYNFAVPVQLKAWLDAIARGGVTFRYTANGPEGLLTGKKVYVVLARGGVHRGTATDSQTAFLQTMLGFLGMTDVEYVYAEGLDMGADALAAGMAAARQAMEQLAGEAMRRAA